MSTPEHVLDAPTLRQQMFVHEFVKAYHPETVRTELDTDGTLWMSEVTDGAMKTAQIDRAGHMIGDWIV